MQILLFNDELKSKYSDDIYEILHLCDRDFIPPLSERNSTMQTDLKTNSGLKGIESYHLEMMEQNILGTVCDDKLAGFVSFKENIKTDFITEKDLPNIYVSTLVLHPDSRGKKLSYKMYNLLFNQLYKSSNLFTRTWSSNSAHINLLSKFEFKEIKRIADDRGKGIDTVYYSLRRD